MLIVMKNHYDFLLNQWDFITAFFITLFCNKNISIKEIGLKGIGIFVKIVMKGDMNRDMEKINNKASKNKEDE